jgi:hypothetical protein
MLEAPCKAHGCVRIVLDAACVQLHDHVAGWRMRPLCAAPALGRLGGPWCSRTANTTTDATYLRSLPPMVAAAPPASLVATWCCWGGRRKRNTSWAPARFHTQQPTAAVVVVPCPEMHVRHTSFIKARASENGTDRRDTARTLTEGMVLSSAVVYNVDPGTGRNPSIRLTHPHRAMMNKRSRDDEGANPTPRAADGRMAPRSSAVQRLGACL